MSCKRAPFPDRDSAEQFLRTGAYTNKTTGQTPIRTYYCTRCRQWHVTSKPRSKRNGKPRR